MQKKLSGLLYRCSMVISIIAVMIMLALMMVVVVGRYCFGKVPAWSEEFALRGMSWLGLMSAAVMEHDRGHIRISAVDKLYPRFLRNVFSVCKYVLKLVLCASMCWYGGIIAVTNRGFLASVPISAGFNYLPGAVAGGVMTLFLLLRAKEELVDIWLKNEDGKEGGQG